MSLEVTGSSFETSFESVIVINEGDGTGGTTDHAELINRDAADQHPISAITGLQEALDSKSELDLMVAAVTLAAGESATATLEDSVLTLGIPCGADGRDGTVSFDDLTDEQRESLRGEQGPAGEPGEQGPAGEPGAPGGPGKDGADGKDGVGIVSIERTAGAGSAGTTDTYTIILTDGRTSEFTVYNGADGVGGSGAAGEAGADGKDGVGIQSIEKVSGDGSAGSTDVYRITLTDGNTAEFTVYNGKDGSDGAPGAAGKDGADGQDGADGKDGISPHIGDNGNWFVGETDTGVAAQGPKGDAAEGGGQAAIMVNGILKGDGTGNIEAAVAGVDYAMPGAGSLVPVIDVLVYTGAEVTCTDGVTTLTATSVDGHCIFQIPNFGRWLVSAELDGTKASKRFTVDTVKLYTLSLWVKNIYGASWDGSSTTAWTRTDASADFDDPVPHLSNGTGSSPFDDIYPWSGMEIVEDGECGTLVSIPKFWFKWTDNGASGLQLQIADFPADGFYVSPAHADRGDGQGERDMVYVGRYGCSSTYVSAAGSFQLMGQTTARTGITARGDGAYVADFAMWQTVNMLYLAEFADWDICAKIGYPSEYNSGGATDSASYHTGTAASARTSNGIVQYRYIEGWYSPKYEVIDGCYRSGGDLYVIKNPQLFNSATTDGVCVGTPISAAGCAIQMEVSTVEGYEYAIYPVVLGGSVTTYTSDYISFSGSNPGLKRNHYNAGTNNGILTVFDTSYTDGAYTRSRLMKLPNNTTTEEE